jgi:hypothetical protein
VHCGSQEEVAEIVALVARQFHSIVFTSELGVLVEAGLVSDTAAAQCHTQS